MPLGAPICALRARARRTSDKGFIGWPTATKGNGDRGGQHPSRRSGHMVNLQDAVRLVGWPTARANDAEKRGDIANDIRNGLARARHLLGWATARARDCKNNGVSKARAAQGICDSLDLQCKLVCKTGTEPPSPLSARTDGAALPLNPRFSLWLQGFPATWADCAPAVTRSSRRSPPSS